MKYFKVDDFNIIIEYFEIIYISLHIKGIYHNMMIIT